MAHTTQDPRVRALISMIDADTKRKEGENKLNAEIRKLKIQHQLSQEDHQANRIFDQNIKNNSPEVQHEQFLRRRLIEQNPLANLTIPTSESQDTSVSFPETKVDMTSAGKPIERKITPAEQKMMFVTRYNQMLEAAANGQGPAPHPAMKAVYDRLFKEVNKIKPQGEGLTLEDVNNAPSTETKTPQTASPNVFERMMQGLKTIMGNSQNQSPGVINSQKQSVKASKYEIGQEVMYQGKSHKVTGIREDGSLELE